uniref:Uncharacterized protein n=1 Tax=Arundo donax TaxID=35708 RepID=A0A0A9DS29_ARUDO
MNILMKVKRGELVDYHIIHINSCHHLIPPFDHNGCIFEQERQSRPPNSQFPNDKYAKLHI